MSKKESKATKDPDKKDDKKVAADALPPEAQKEGKKRKFVLIAGIAGVLLAAFGAGGFFVFKTFFEKSTTTKLSAKSGADAHDKPASEKDEHGSEAKKDEHGADAKKDEHGAAAKKDEHGAEAKKDEHGAEAKKDEHGADAKKDEHGADAKKDGHGADAKKEDGKAEGGGEKNKGEESQGKSSIGETFGLERFDLNLGNPIENRFLRVSIAVEYRGGEEQLAELKKRVPQLRDIVITTVAAKNRMELLTDKGKSKLRREILNKVNEVADRPIAAVYFTDFIVE